MEVTAKMLPAEREKASFNVETMTNFLDNGPEQTKKRRFILSTQEDYTYGHEKYGWERPQYLKEHVKSFIEIHEDFVGKWKPTRDELVWMSEFAMNSGPLWNTLGPSLLCLRGLASDEQQGWWLQRTIKMEIVVSYAQTELGHGSNVRGLRTEAVYDPAMEEFVVSTPDLLSMKWWPGAMGKVISAAMPSLPDPIRHTDAALGGPRSRPTRSCTRSSW